ncbi:hypothetical protein A2303_05100 [Candidatus Falkowbacteria bacterium RIFOXYB2_FULL_47_14]|uniref:Uncharacterized protein n=1 Tax=Candidatus Falkowbacteria bacterium RIFOXYA2_FULL_47_19 TaxID=1797994 RepID=A0A1F5SJW9_9BACT|nr:MAG: hypothetical protein A2227_06480 [Candidatus Falkowbacteria bacterium RIFOXYA2_FULL_47_19]OGF35735.1 MAG: hypothetical protein A2468_05155 [Candidatus Falkowbacteria bacterium RIFOXYC2_FULL_46_15]OGF43294.1 MAG: hypothetical protein A2303_05100 [Candidatus Falkowbacteria bacterium RIFOXYB2_FULL_47_14]
MNNDIEPKPKRKHIYVIGGMIIILVLAAIFRLVLFPSALNKEKLITPLGLSNINIQPKIIKKKTFNADIVQLQKYHDLRESGLNIRTIEEIKFGREDIFSE